MQGPSVQIDHNRINNTTNGLLLCLLLRLFNELQSDSPLVQPFSDVLVYH